MRMVRCDQMLMSSSTGWVGIIMALLVASLAMTVQWRGTGPIQSDGSALAPGFRNLPLAFVPNVGQASQEARFVVRGVGANLFFAPDSVSLASRGAEARLVFDGANPSVELRGADRLPGEVNYYLGQDPTLWRSGLPTYGAMVYHQLYPGTDLRYEGISGSLKGTYTIAPGADPTLIRWHYEGATSVHLDEKTGNLIITRAPVGPDADPAPRGEGNRHPAEGGNGGVPAPIAVQQGGGEGSLVEGAPVAWQTVNGRQVPVEARYALYSKTTPPSIGFALGAYEPALPLTVDPTLSYSTYLGGSQTDEAKGIAVDASGNVYVTGGTSSTDLAGTTRQSTGSEDVFIAKLNPAGTALVYSTYLGGTAGERGSAISIDGSGNAFVTGSTQSSDFPVTASAAQPGLGGSSDGFIAKLNETGQLSYSTYLGDAGSQFSNAIAVDGAGNAFVTGYASGDVLLAKLNASGDAFVYPPVAFGGPDEDDEGQAIAVDSAGNVYITGKTKSVSFPVGPGSPQESCSGDVGFCQDAFVSVVNAAGDELLYSTYLGGDANDEGTGIAVERSAIFPNGHIHVAGNTASPNFPTLNPIQTTSCTPTSNCQDAFVAKLNPSTGLVYSTYLRGKDDDYANGIAVDRDGNAFVAGMTLSTDFPVINAIRSSLGAGICYKYPLTSSDPRACYDAFIAKLNAAGSELLFSTYLGGEKDDQATAIAIDTSDAGSAYVTGWTQSADFPATDGALQQSPAGTSSPQLRWPSSAFVAKITLASAPGTTPTPTATPVGEMPARAYLPFATRSHAGGW